MYLLLTIAVRGLEDREINSKPPRSSCSYCAIPGDTKVTIENDEGRLFHVRVVTYGEATRPRLPGEGGPQPGGTSIDNLC